MPDLRAGVLFMVAILAVAACGGTKKTTIDGSTSGDAPADHGGSESAPCSGTAPSCLAGGLLGTGIACGDVSEPATCMGGGWACALGWVPAGACTCHGPNYTACMCTAHGWECPDAGADAKPPADGPTDQAPSACAFSTTYTFGDDGGLRAFTDGATLSPPRTHTIMRTGSGRADASGQCMRDVPCTSASAVSVAAVEAAIANADVQAALAKPAGMVYGTDTRPADGSVFTFSRADGRGFLVGAGAVPTGLRALEELLHQLETETLAAPECASLSN
jgi:hypothetical protein